MDMISLSLNCGVVALSFFLEKNETKKSSSLSNRCAFKGVRDDRHTSCDYIEDFFKTTI